MVMAEKGDAERWVDDLSAVWVMETALHAWHDVAAMTRDTNEPILQVASGTARTHLLNLTKTAETMKKRLARCQCRDRCKCGPWARNTRTELIQRLDEVTFIDSPHSPTQLTCYWPGTRTGRANHNGLQWTSYQTDWTVQPELPLRH